MAILSSSTQTFDLSVPVLIIGGGACGICAALSANESGTETMILERDQTASGSSALSTCLIPAAGTKLQKEAGINDSPEVFAADLIKKAKKQTDSDMALWIAEKSGPTVDWLMDKTNLKLSLITGFYYPGHTHYRMHGSPNRTGAELMAALNDAVASKSIDLVTSACVTDLYADDNQRVHGVRVTRPDGKTEIIGCKFLILACNGYGGNPTMVKKYLPEMAEAWYFGHVGNKGDAVTWGAELGGKTADMGGYQGHGGVTHPHGTLLFWGLLTEGGIQVNVEGKRFSNEVRGYSEQAVDVISQPTNIVWEIWGERGHKLGLDFQDYRNGMEVGAHKKANSVEGIAEQAGLSLAHLKQTFSDIEICVSEKTEDQFGRNWSNTELIQPPFYFAKVTGALFHTQGGLVVDKCARVIGKNGKPLPNLFAGGGAARGLSGPSRWGYLSGNGLLTATVLGRIAGLEAAKMASGKHAS